VLCRKAKFLAVNTQTNSANLGYNLITKYPKVDYICIDEPEMRYAARDKYGDIRAAIERIAGELHCGKVAVTRGHLGAVTYDRASGFTEIPIFSDKIVDRVGAGDAFLSVSAPMAAAGLPMDVVGLVGNLAAKMTGKAVEDFYHLFDLGHKNLLVAVRHTHRPPQSGIVLEPAGIVLQQQLQVFCGLAAAGADRDFPVIQHHSLNETAKTLLLQLPLEFYGTVPVAENTHKHPVRRLPADIRPVAGRCQCRRALLRAGPVAENPGLNKIKGHRVQFYYLTFLFRYHRCSPGLHPSLVKSPFLQHTGIVFTQYRPAGQSH